MDAAKATESVAAIFAGASTQAPSGASGARPQSSSDSGSTSRTVLIGALVAVALGALLALTVLLRIALRDRKLARLPDQPHFEAPAGPPPLYGGEGPLPAGREFLRVYGDRLRVAIDERGIEVAIVGLGLAAAVVLGALVAG